MTVDLLKFAVNIMDLKINRLVEQLRNRMIRKNSMHRVNTKQLLNMNNTSEEQNLALEMEVKASQKIIKNDNWIMLYLKNMRRSL